MKSKVLLIGIVVVQLVAGAGLFTGEIEQNDKLETTQIVQPTPVPTITPIPTNTPIKQIDDSNGPIKVEHVVAHGTFQMSREGVERSYRITDKMLEEYLMLNMRGTSYTLSVASCGKKRSHPQYGITFSGIRAQVRRTVAVDPRVISLGSVLYIKFPEYYSFRDGLYIADDTGGKVKGDILDVFFGEDKPGETVIEKQCAKFGMQKLKVYIVERGE